MTAFQKIKELMKEKTAKAFLKILWISFTTDIKFTLAMIVIFWAFVAAIDYHPTFVILSFCNLLLVIVLGNWASDYNKET